MNGRNALARDNGSTLNAHSRARLSQRRKTRSAAPRKNWFPRADGTPDPELREVVAQRFMSMNEAHDRIRTELLASRVSESR
jgi:hypothetical protein